MLLLPNKMERLTPSRPADTGVLRPQNILLTQLLQLLTEGKLSLNWQRSHAFMPGKSHTI